MAAYFCPVAGGRRDQQGAEQALPATLPDPGMTQRKYPGTVTGSRASSRTHPQRACLILRQAGIGAYATHAARLGTRGNTCSTILEDGAKLTPFHWAVLLIAKLS